MSGALSIKFEYAFFGPCEAAQISIHNGMILTMAVLNGGRPKASMVRPSRNF
jgi:hypothetical protein